MNAMPTSTSRDDLEWTAVPPGYIEVFRPPVPQTAPLADIIQFRLVNLADHPWKSAPDAEQDLPPIASFTPQNTAGNCRRVTGRVRPVEATYIVPRLRQDSRHATYQMDSESFDQPVFVTVMPPFHRAANSLRSATYRHSTAVLHGGHLMHCFGCWIVALLTIQLISAWKVGTIAGQTLGTGSYFHSATWLFFMATSNLWVWFHYYGKESKAFHVPGIGLFLAAILPAFLLQLLAMT